MPWDLATDPITGDFVSDGAGGWVRTEYGDTAVLHQLSCHYDRWWGDPLLGSLLYDRDRFTSAPAPLVEAETKRALAVLAADKLIADVTAAAQEVGAGRVDVETTYRLVATDQAITARLTALGG